ncbi:MAG TPA: hypothetical protein PKY73_18830 [Hyphomonas sp.]|nr:hypothetical protein [Hyphomonas sp.]
MPSGLIQAIFTSVGTPLGECRLIQIRFAEENEEYADWKNVGVEFFYAYFDANIATASGANRVGGVSENTGKMGRAIAYSALEAGEGDNPCGCTRSWPGWWMPRRERR